MSKGLRREPRVHTTLDIELETAGVSSAYQTSNASFRGLFLVSENPLPLRRLVRIRPRAEDVDVELLGIVAHTVNAADAYERDDDPGMGISLFGLNPDHRERWEEFIRTEYEKDPEAHAALMASELPRLHVHLKNQKMKDQFFGSDFPSGEIFYRTPELYPEGTRVTCEVKHPESGRVLELMATVVEVVPGSRRKRGIRVAFDELSEASAHRFDRFERGEMSEASEVSELSPDDLEDVTSDASEASEPSEAEASDETDS